MAPRETNYSPSAMVAPSPLIMDPFPPCTGAGGGAREAAETKKLPLKLSLHEREYHLNMA